MSRLRAFTMPKWGIEMTEGQIAEWSVEEGDAVTAGQLLASVETEKIVNDIEAEFDAVCLRRIAAEGDTIAVGELLAVFGEAGTPADEIDAFVADFQPADIALSGETGEPGETDSAPVHEPVVALPEPVVIPDGVRASPRAAQLAAEFGIDLATVPGSGRAGRVQLQDVQRLAMLQQPRPVATPAKSTVPHATGGVQEPWSKVRAVIARRLTASWRDIPHYYLEVDAQIDALRAARACWNQGRDDKASLNDFIVRAAARALVQHSDVNVQVGDTGVVRFTAAHVAIAVAASNGLVAPVVQDADSVSFPDLCARTRGLVVKARDGKLARSDLEGGSFTVSNLGMFGVDRFTALINAPQAAILSVGTARRVAVERAEGVAFETRMSLTLGCDHRAIDGATGGAFLAAVKAALENPQALLV